MVQFMRNDRIIAIKLRKQGKSYNEISRKLIIPKSTIAHWFKDIDWSKDIKNQLKEKAKKISRKRLKRLIVYRRKALKILYENAENEAGKEFDINKNNMLFISGTMLYWGEGDKKFENGSIKLGNTDPHILKIFKIFLLQFCNRPLEKIKAWMLLYPDLEVDSCLNYWSKKTGLPKNNFTKPTFILGRHKTHRLQYGTCTIQTGNKYLKKKILTWIDLYRKELSTRV